MTERSQYSRRAQANSMRQKFLHLNACFTFGIGRLYCARMPRIWIATLGAIDPPRSERLHAALECGR